MHVVSGDEVRGFLESAKRVYLCGNLTLPDVPSFCKTDGLEIGISRYQDYTKELPHLHSWNHEYNYISRGSVKVYVLPEKKEYCLYEGDLFEIAPGMGYVTKCSPGTEVIFVKSPGGNDKVFLPLSEGIQKWQSCWENEMEPDET